MTQRLATEGRPYRQWLYWVVFWMTFPFAVLLLYSASLGGDTAVWITARLLAGCLFLLIAVQCGERIFSPQSAARRSAVLSDKSSRRLRLAGRVIAIVAVVVLFVVFVCRNLWGDRFDLTSDLAVDSYILFAVSFALSDLGGVGLFSRSPQSDVAD